jgi:hypothetical protein
MARSSAEAGVIPGDPLPGWAGGPVSERGLVSGEGADRDQALKRTRCRRGTWFSSGPLSGWMGLAAVPVVWCEGTG